MNIPMSTRFLPHLLILLSALASGTAIAGNSCVVLQYHHFSETTPAVTSVSPAQFEQHLEYLEKNHFSVLPLQKVISDIQQGKDLPGQCVSLTVDDAYISVYETAFPLLQKRHWPLTVFVNTQAVDEGRQPYMSWEQMREMSKHGVTFENHGHSHDHLVRMQENESLDDWEQRVSADILTAQNRITDELGIAPTFFAHPYGEYNPAIIKLLKKFKLTGFGQQSGPIWSDANFGALPRFPMAAQYARMETFATKTATLPMPVVSTLPDNPVLEPGNTRPELILQLETGKFAANNITCFINGSDNVSQVWADDNTLIVSPNFDLPAGRSRTNCTMPSNQKGRFHWYSHNWIKRNSDGSWYSEY
jgi:biofilm PGA synthesis lipoprotein PgaB